MARPRSVAAVEKGDPRLPKFQGRPVKSMKIAIRKAGDGLSEALSIEPNPHNSGDETFFIIRCIVGPIDHNPTALLANAPFIRVEDHIAQEMVEVDGDDVKAYLDQSREAIAAAKAEAEEALESEKLAGGQGIQPKLATVPDEAPINEAHDDGGDHVSPE